MTWPDFSANAQASAFDEKDFTNLFVLEKQRVRHNSLRHRQSWPAMDTVQHKANGRATSSFDRGGSATRRPLDKVAQLAAVGGRRDAHSQKMAAAYG